MKTKKKDPGRFMQFYKAYWIEILSFAAVLFGIFLLVEPFDIREDLWRFLQQVSEQLLLVFNRVIDWFLAISLSDMVGLMLIVFVGAFLAWRVRYHIAHSRVLSSDMCPRCSSPLIRKHRNPIDRTLEWSLRLSIRRYQCSSESCEWTGLRRRLPDYQRSRSIESDLVMTGENKPAQVTNQDRSRDRLDQPGI